MSRIRFTTDMLRHIRMAAEAERARRERMGLWSGGVQAHVEYQNDPVGWLRDKMGIPENTIRWSLNPEYERCHCLRCKEHGNEGRPHLWDGTPDPLAVALELIAQGKSVAVSSGTGTGKTFTLGAGATLWFLAAFPHSVVYSIAPKQDLLLKNMWKEIGAMLPTFKRHFPQAQALTGTLRMLDGEGEQELWTATAFGAGVGADEELAQRLKGFHRSHMLWIIEEMPGVVNPMVETIVKTATGAFNPIIGLGNPEHQHDTLALFAKRSWVTPIRISALDFPNVVANREIIPGARSRESVLRDLEDAGGDPTDPKYLSQVRGIAPAQSRNALIRWEWLEEAAARWKEDRQKAADLRVYQRGANALGVDVADSPTGDYSAISYWQGAMCIEIERFREKDASAVGRRIWRIIRSEDFPVDPKRVGIDSIGVGASAVNELARLGVKVRKIVGNARATPQVDLEERYSRIVEDDEGIERPAGQKVVEAEVYANLRSQVYWRLREDLRLGRIALPRDQRLFEDLTAIEYSTQGGKITVESKGDLKDRIGRSPDMGDAVAYGNWVRARTRDLTRVPKDRYPRDRNRDYGLERLIAQREKERKAQDREAKRILRAMRVA